MTTIPLVNQPTKNTAMGVFENNGQNDIFQIVGPDGGVQVHMGPDGTLDPPVYPVKAVVHVSSAQLLALKTTPVTVLPAPGPGLFILPEQFCVQYKAGSTPYTIGGAEQYFYVAYGGALPGNADDSVALIPDAGFLDQATDQLIMFSAFQSVSVPQSEATNQPLLLTINDTLTLGNGTVVLTFWYRILAS